MHFLVLCVSLFLAASPSKTAPLIGGIRMSAETTMIRINNLRAKWSVTPSTEPTPSVEGLTSTCHYLGLLAEQLQAIDRFDQIQMDIQNICGWVCNHASTMNCPIQERPSVATATICYPRTEGFKVLDKVESYLTKILSSNRLTVC